MSSRYTSLRYRLLSLVLVPLVLLAVTVMLLAYRWSSNYTYEQLFVKVNTDLRVARDSFSDIEANGQRQLLALANSARLTAAIEAGNRVAILQAGLLLNRNFTFVDRIRDLVYGPGSLAAAVAAIVGARSIFAPIEAITSVVRATARGEHRRIGPMSTGNEIGELASQFDAMLISVDLHRQRIERDALLLEEKVALRTSELEQQNGRLQDSIELLKRTRRQLATAEKLAALGELTAGVAHEINNPTAVVLGNMDVLVADLGVQRKSVQT